MEYTKGEWKVITNGSSLLAIASTEHRNICSFEPLYLRGEKTNLYRQLSGEDEANANLIAAAPIMHGQLETGRDALLEALNDINGGRISDAETRIKGVRAGNELALAKAKGE